VTDSLEDVIAETRKYGVSITLAHQYMRQFGMPKIDALSSVGTTVVFNVDSKDAAYLAKDFQELVKVKDIVELEVGQAIVRCGTIIARIRTPQPAPIPQENLRELIVAQSRKKYCLPAVQIHQMIERRGNRTNRPFESLSAMADEGKRDHGSIFGGFDYDEH
jgi:hypothetical protein